MVRWVLRHLGRDVKRWKCSSDHIFDFTWSGYKIIPNMWSKLTKVSEALGAAEILGISWHDSIKIPNEYLLNSLALIRVWPE